MTKEKLTNIINQHNKWLLDRTKGVRADLSGTDLRGTDLRGANLRGANLRGADLRGADLRGANLRGADLSGTDLRGANLRGANLRGADLRGANLRGANLRGANLRDADIDFSMWPLWCGSLGVNVDTRIRKQLAYHLLAIIGDDMDNFCADPIGFANGFHRVEECGELKK